MSCTAGRRRMLQVMVLLLAACGVSARARAEQTREQLTRLFTAARADPAQVVPLILAASAELARLDGKQALQLIAQDAVIDHEFKSIMRNLITFMMEDPRTISSALDTLWVAKAIERIGDHAKNIAEYVIYVVEGKDIRHTKPAAPVIPDLPAA